MISTAIDIIVQISRFPDGTRKITGITEVVGLDDQRDLILKDIFTFERQGLDVDGKVLGEYKATGYLPRCLEEFSKKGVPIDVNIFNP